MLGEQGNEEQGDEEQGNEEDGEQSHEEDGDEEDGDEENGKLEFPSEFKSLNALRKRKLVVDIVKYGNWLTFLDFGELF